MLDFPDIPELDELLYQVDAALGASESHGALCGMLCAQGATEASQWMLHVLGEHDETSRALQDAGSYPGKTCGIGYRCKNY